MIKVKEAQTNLIHKLGVTLINDEFSGNINIKKNKIIP